MQLSEIRVKIAPVVFDKKKGRLTGGEHVQMSAEEKPNGAWIHFERREVPPNEMYQSGTVDGTVGEFKPFPEGQKQRVVGVLHQPSGEVIEHHLFDAHGIPVAKHPMETE